MSTYAIQIADMAEAILTANLRSEFKTFARIPLEQLNPADLPILGIFILRDRRTADGDPNHAEPRFIHQLTLGFSGAVAIDTQDRKERARALEDVMSRIDDLLLKNIPFVNLTEGFESMDRTSQVAKQSDTTLYEIRVEMTLRYRSNFIPDVPDDFLVLHVTTQYPDEAHVQSGTQQIEAEYDVPQT